VNGGDVLLGDGTLTKTDPNPGDLEEGTEGCAATTSKAELSPVYLLFLLDESGSMGDDESMNREERWDPVTTALKAFFADAASSGLLASLSLFPNDKNKTKGSGTRLRTSRLFYARDRSARAAGCHVVCRCDQCGLAAERVWNAHAARPFRNSRLCAVVAGRRCFSQGRSGVGDGRRAQPM